MSPRRGRVGLVARRVALCAVSIATAAGAQQTSPRTQAPIGDKALPGYSRISIPGKAATGLRVQLGVGYGFTEDQALAPGSHHRLVARGALGLRPLDWLGVSAVSRVQVDQHEPDDLGADIGIVWESNFAANAGTQVSPNVRVGAELGLELTQGDSIGESLASPAVGLVLLGAYAPPGAPYTLGLAAGYRYDRRRLAVGEPGRFRAGDRLALGVSEFDALPLGLGGSYRSGDTMWLAELSGEVLVGSDAPSLLRSPLRATLGARWALTRKLVVRALLDLSLSRRPGEAERDQLVPVEPRVAFRIGVEFPLLGEPEPVAAVLPPPARAVPTEPVEAPVAVAPKADFEVAVTGPDGHPLSDATVVLERNQAVLPVPHSSREVYRQQDLEFGRYTLRVTAARLKEHTAEVELGSEGAGRITVQLEAAAPAGQIRGLIRSYLGEGMSAQVRIEPLGKVLTTGSDGTFTVDVPPGSYQVFVEAVGHRSQRRQLRVQRDGVVVLNADMQRGSP